MSARAELLADEGAAAVEASGAHLFRGPRFLAAESTTHTLRIAAEAGELLAPLIVREIGDGPDLDATSPYGYPGFTTSDGAAGSVLDPQSIDFSETGLVSAFIRHRLDAVPLAGATERNVVQIADPALDPKSRPSDRRQVRRNLEAGYRIEIVPGPDADPSQRTGFIDVYEQTMRRTDAAEHYFFPAPYFDAILSEPGTWLALAHAPEGSLAAASIAAVSDDYLHYYLSGSADTHLSDSPMKNIVSELIDLSKQLSLPLNLGGGITPGDPLEEFKRGWANRTKPWQTSELICNPTRYAELSESRPPSSSYFPAYRAP